MPKMSPERYQQYLKTCRENRKNNVPKPHSMHVPVKREYDEDSPSYDFRDQPEFKAYRQLIERTLKRLKRAVTIRELHTALGDAVRREYTFDALEGSYNVIWFKGYIDKFCWFEGIKLTEPLLWNGNAQLGLKDRKKNLSADLGLVERVTA